ncbi:MAG: ASCH domain-containing protein [Phycisphaerae bacterium]
MLLLKRHLVDLVRRGKKRQTIRLWTKPLLRPGQISYTPGLGKMKITAVDLLPSLNALTEADARADGFDSLAALKNEIKKIYGPNISQILNTPRPARRIYRIQFQWPIDPAGQKLVLPPPPPARPQKSIHPRTPAASAPTPPPKPREAHAPRKRRSTGMTPHQQQLLRNFIVAKHPHNAHTARQPT